jgi:hypothetical protein
MRRSVCVPGSHAVEKQLEVIELTDKFGFPGFYFNESRVPTSTRKVEEQILLGMVGTRGPKAFEPAAEASGRTYFYDCV